jgi:hypothetical protein
MMLATLLPQLQRQETRTISSNGLRRSSQDRESYFRFTICILGYKQLSNHSWLYFPHPSQKIQFDHEISIRQYIFFNILEEEMNGSHGFRSSKEAWEFFRWKIRLVLYLDYGNHDLINFPTKSDCETVPYRCFKIERFIYNADSIGV